MKTSQLPFVAIFLIGCFIALTGTAALSTTGTEAHISMSARTNVGVGVAVPITVVLYEGSGAAYGALQGEGVELLIDGAVVFTGTTNEQGRFAYSHAFATAGQHIVSASWAGDETHGPVLAGMTVNILESATGDGDEADGDGSGFIDDPNSVLFGSVMAMLGVLGIYRSNKNGGV